MSNLLEIQNLHAGIGEKIILRGINLALRAGEVHVVMGPNGAGKSTLSNCIVGNPQYKISDGDISFEGKSIKDLKVDERARLGIFMSFQQPMAINGVKNSDFIRQAMISCGKGLALSSFFFQYEKACKELGMEAQLARRHLNVGFSGGEMKKNEILQMKLLKPKLAILDEIDSGLDVDALKIIGQNISEEKDLACLIITHQAKILDYVKADFVHVLVEGQIVKTGDISLVKKIEEEGYQWLQN